MHQRSRCWHHRHRRFRPGPRRPFRLEPCCCRHCRHHRYPLHHCLPRHHCHRCCCHCWKSHWLHCHWMRPRPRPPSPQLPCACCYQRHWRPCHRSRQHRQRHCYRPWPLPRLMREARKSWRPRLTCHPRSRLRHRPPHWPWPCWPNCHHWLNRPCRCHRHRPWPRYWRHYRSWRPHCWHSHPCRQQHPHRRFRHHQTPCPWPRRHSHHHRCHPCRSHLPRSPSWRHCFQNR